MAYEEKLQSISLVAGGDLSADIYKFVDQASDGQIDVVSGAGGKSVGVLQDKPAAAGRVANVGFAGITKIVLGATLAAGARVMSSAAGVAVAATTTNLAQGVLLEGGDSGEIVPMLITLNSYTA